MRFSPIVLSLSLLGRAQAAVKGVFAHYMVGGIGSSDEALQDINDAQALGLDAFALNVQYPSDDWTTWSLDYLFDAADAQNFSLFFSMDMNVISAPSDFLPLFGKYVNRQSYYTYASRPFLSTFNGGQKTFGQATPNAGWQAELKTALAYVDIDPFFVPDFDDYTGTGSAYTAQFFTNYTVVDGVMAWETAWPSEGAGLANITDTVDTANLQAARDAGKVYMMPVSTFQAKHMDTADNWYRRGELTLPLRIQQALALQPDFVELLTWNDAGEGHYFGNIWPESLNDSCTDAADANCAIAHEIAGYDHTAWQAVLAPFVSALKYGTTESYYLYPFGEFAGCFWYRPLMKDADCSGDRYGLAKPGGWDNAEDLVNIAILMPAGTDTEGVTIQVTSGSSTHTFDATQGLNMFEYPAATGAQEVQIVKADGSVLGAGTGTVDVTSSIADLDNICNFNYQVVHVA